MVRVGGMTYACDPGARIGARISDMRLRGKPLEPARRYKVAGWASVAENAQGEPVWEVVERWLKERRTIPALKPNAPRLVGVQGNPGIAP